MPEDDGDGIVPQPDQIDESSPLANGPEPTDLLVPWMADSEPTQTEVIAALRSAAGAKLQVLDELESDDAEICWGVVVRREDLDTPCILWAEASRGFDYSDDNTRETPEERISCRWHIGFETMLDPEDPLTTYRTIVGWLASALSDAPGVFDVNINAWHPRAALDSAYLKEGAEPPVFVLWAIHAVAPDDDKGDDAPVEGETQLWLHTHGLWRCGVPELEMLGVPARHADAAAEVINHVAALLLEEPLPQEPGEAFTIGTDLAVSFQPWDVAMEAVAADAPGGSQDRADSQRGDQMHVGPRVVICRAPSQGKQRRLSKLWPKAVVQAIEKGQAALYVTHRETERQALRARTTWPEFATAFASLRDIVESQSHGGGLSDRMAVFLVKSAFASALQNEPDHEHLWVEVKRMEGDAAEGTLLNQPLIAAHLKQGMHTRVQRDNVSGWHVLIDGHGFGPDALPQMWRAVDAVRAQA